jgi:hypothetical protein
LFSTMISGNKNNITFFYLNQLSIDLVNSIKID